MGVDSNRRKHWGHGHSARGCGARLPGFISANCRLCDLGQRNLNSFKPPHHNLLICRTHLLYRAIMTFSAILYTALLGSCLAQRKASKCVSYFSCCWYYYSNYLGIKWCKGWRCFRNKFQWSWFCISLPSTIDHKTGKENTRQSDRKLSKLAYQNIQSYYQNRVLPSCFFSLFLLVSFFHLPIFYFLSFKKYSFVLL